MRKLAVQDNVGLVADPRDEAHAALVVAAIAAHLSLGAPLTPKVEAELRAIRSDQTFRSEIARSIQASISEGYLSPSFGGEVQEFAFYGKS